MKYILHFNFVAICKNRVYNMAVIIPTLFPITVSLRQNCLTSVLWNLQKQPPEVFCKTGVLRNFAKFTGKQLCWRLFFNKVAGPCNFIKKESLAQVFPGNFGKFLITPFFKEHLRTTASEPFGMEPSKKVSRENYTEYKCQLKDVLANRGLAITTEDWP